MIPTPDRILEFYFGLGGVETLCADVVIPDRYSQIRYRTFTTGPRTKRNAPDPAFAPKPKWIACLDHRHLKIGRRPYSMLDGETFDMACFDFIKPPLIAVVQQLTGM
jgi:hypothetical protein